MIKNCLTIALITSLLAGGCNKTKSENGATNNTNYESGKMAAAYMFLLDKLQEDNVTLIVSENDKNLNPIQDIIREEGLKLEVEKYSNIEKGPDLCYYSKSTKKLVAVIDVTKKSEDSYYVSYYLGPEGGASKEIQIEKKNEGWAVVNDDGMWNVK
ncbi:MAG TPA: hypothetical protein VMX36_00910 [Sedimentisphaerales bacterium]|nr:hypothetical protein [Sedimentisphaerales bacterium]